MDRCKLVAIITTVAVVFLLLIIIIAVTASSNSVWFEIDHFTAELYEKDLNSHSHRSRQVVFDKTHWYVNFAYKKELKYAYQYGDGKVVGICKLIGGHTNCVVLYDIHSFTFSISKSFSRTKGVDCPSVSPPIFGGANRTLGKCDEYKMEYTHPDYNVPAYDAIWVESGTNYPVKKRTYIKYEGNWVTIAFTEYSSFDPEMPTDKSFVGPVPGVKVWDLRTGHSGLYSDGKNTQEEASWFNKLSEKVTRKTIPKISMEKLHSMIGFFDPSVGVAPSTNMYTRATIPKSFDSRIQWSMCSVIRRISHQLDCGSCWAMSSSAVLSDRVCIATNGIVNVALSPQYMINCFKNQKGCEGGYVEPVWRDLMEIGTVPESCIPFQASLGKCPTKCANGTSLPKRTKAKNVYSPWGETDTARVEAIQRDIMTHGPVQSSYYAFSDFAEHRDSIYHRSMSATFVSGHAIRIIGWGTESGQDYWLVANSWGTDWKDGGFFKIRRGNNECNIEEQVVAGDPLLN